MGNGTLDDYARRRDFGRTPEPPGTLAAEQGRRFVVQMHAARRLHFDFRLELDGSLKSWAVPKGPSFDPGERRLAVQVEDHPVEYGGFEGVIPAGEYGAGTVLLWDQGEWEPVGDARSGLRKGRLHFRLRGSRLHGEWALARMHGEAAGENRENWLLIKIADRWAQAGDPGPADTDVSVSSGRTLHEIAAHPAATWDPTGRHPGEPMAPPAPLPATLEPQLATLVERPPTGPEWLHEIKFDGYRTLTRIERGRVTMFSRNGKDWTHRFGALARALERLPLESAWLDGEVTVPQPDGRTSFAALQQALSEERDERLVYFLFDLLFHDGRDLRDQPLAKRKAALASLLAAHGPAPLRYADHLHGDGATVFQEACRLGLEGLVCKRGDRPWNPGRGRDWLKLKCWQRQEFVIGGYTAPSGSRKGLGALLVGYYDDDRLRYAGRVGTGYTEATLHDLEARLALLRSATPPFVDPVPPGRTAITWVRPELVAEVAFANWTADQVLRHPSFQGLREDKPAREVGREQAQPTQNAAPANDRIAGLRLSNPDKPLYPAQGITKRDLARYYEQVADALLPDLAGRPLTLLRCPEGHQLPCFYQKHAGSPVPPEVRRIPIEEKGKPATYLMVDDLPGVIALVQMGVLEIHTWGAHADNPDQPDRLVLDLDPAPELPWSAVVEAAHTARALLDELGLTSFLRSTGGKGLHVVVPLRRGPGWDEVKAVSRAIAAELVRAEPRSYTASPTLARRKGKLYIDWLRNGRGATAIANYATRARPGAPVATPLSWDELTPELRPAERYTLATVPARIAAVADPWADYPRRAQSLTAALRKRLGLA